MGFTDFAVCLIILLILVWVLYDRKLLSENMNQPIAILYSGQDRNGISAQVTKEGSYSVYKLNPQLLGNLRSIWMRDGYQMILFGDPRMTSRIGVVVTPGIINLATIQAANSVSTFAIQRTGKSIV